MTFKNLSILIVEDDINIRNYLKSLINNSSIGFAVIAEADNGLAGAALAKKVMPDIIITDIFMPIMSGFEMLEDLSEYNFETIVLSGYDDFEYLKTALKYNVKDYLLKPISETDLFNTLQALREKMSGKQTRLNADTIHYIRSHYIHDLFRNNTKYANPDIFLSLLSVAHNSPLAVVYITCFDTEMTELQNALIKHFPDDITVDFSSSGVFIIHKNQNKLDTARLYSEYISHFSGMFSHIGISIPATTSDNIITAIFDAYRCVEYQKLTDDNHFYTNALIPDHPKDVNDLYESFNLLYQYIDDNDKYNTFHKLETLFEDGFFFGDFPKFKSLIMKFLFHLENKYSTLFDGISNSIEIDIDKFDDLISLRTHIFKIVDEIINEKTTESQKYHKVVRDAIALIHSNYATITIEQIAEQLYISPSYLMYLFKQDTNETLYNYIIDYRISVACQLLKEGQRVYEVSEMVGYKSVKFFSTMFKKKTGLTPSEYIKQNQK